MLQGAAIRDGEEIEKALRRAATSSGSSTAPGRSVTPEKLVRSLFTTPAFLAEAADGILDEPEQRLAAAARQRGGATATWRCSTRRTRSSASRRARTTT